MVLLNKETISELQVKELIDDLNDEFNKIRNGIEEIRTIKDTITQKELEKRTARFLSLSCRIAAELGASIVKTYYCAEDFDKVTDGCPVPVVIAGGPKCETELEVFEFVYDGMKKGAIGVNLGRNVWQNPHPVPVAKALRAIVHENATPEEAHKLFNESKNSG